MKSYLFFKLTQVIFIILFFIIFLLSSFIVPLHSAYYLILLFSGMLFFLLFWTLDMIHWNHHKKSEKKPSTSDLDPLTELPSSAFLKQELTKLSLSVLCDDISCVTIIFDNIHLLNRTYGHSVGDIVLKEFGDILRNSVPDTGFIGRKSGRTFLALFREAPHTNTELFLQNLKKGVEIHNRTQGLLPIFYHTSVSHNDELRYASIYDLIKLRTKKQNSHPA